MTYKYSTRLRCYMTIQVPDLRIYFQDRAISLILLNTCILTTATIIASVNNINICVNSFDNRLQYSNTVYIFGL